MVDLLPIAHSIVIFAVAFQIYRRQSVLRRAFWPAFAIRLICGICVGLLYTYYYPVADTFVYFQDASKLASLAPEEFTLYLKALFSGNDPGLRLTLTEPRSLFFTRITSIFVLIGGGNYWVIAIYYSFISFAASWFLVRVIAVNLPGMGVAAACAFLFLPSAALWTSGVLKESLAVSALLYLSGIFLAAWFKSRIKWWHIPLVLLALWVLWNLKYFYAGIFVATLATTALYQVIFRKRSALPELLLWLGLLVVFLASVTFLHPNFRLDKLFAVIVANNTTYVELSDPGDFVQFENLSATVPGVLFNAPRALLSGLFRPLLWEASSGVQLLAGIENVLLLVFFAGALWKAGLYVRSPHRILILSVIVYVALLSVFITLSAPNFGTLSRYRTGYITFFCFLILCKNPLFAYVERSFAGLLESK